MATAKNEVFEICQDENGRWSWIHDTYGKGIGYDSKEAAERAARECIECATQPSIEQCALGEELTKLLNRHSCENNSNTPDFLLARYLLQSLEVYERAVRARDSWYSIAPEPGWSHG